MCIRDSAGCARLEEEAQRQEKAAESLPVSLVARPVSYTHLDVYKRQVLRQAFFRSAHLFFARPFDLASGAFSVSPPRRATNFSMVTLVPLPGLEVTFSRSVKLSITEKPSPDRSSPPVV